MPLTEISCSISEDFYIVHISKTSCAYATVPDGTRRYAGWVAGTGYLHLKFPNPKNSIMNYTIAAVKKTQEEASDADASANGRSVKLLGCVQ